MLRKTLVPGALSIALAVTSMPAMAAPLAPSMPEIDNPAVTQVARRKVVRKRVVVRRPFGWRGHGPYFYDNDFDVGAGLAAGIIGFGLGAALAGAAADRPCYVQSGNVVYRVDCDSIGR